MHNLTTADGVAAHMSESTSTEDWNNRCNEVKDANNGDYPSFWYPTIVASGLVDKTLGAGSSTIKFRQITPDR